MIKTRESLDVSEFHPSGGLHVQYFTKQLSRKVAEVLVEHTDYFRDVTLDPRPGPAHGSEPTEAYAMQVTFGKQRGSMCISLCVSCDSRTIAHIRPPRSMRRG